MKAKFLLGLASLMGLSGCASAGREDLPSGIGRKPVNTPAAIAAFENAPPPTVYVGTNDTRIDRQVGDLTRQVSELKAYLVMIQMAQEQKSSDGALAQAEPSSSSSGQKVKASDVVQAQSVSFSVTHLSGKSTMAAPIAEETQLLLAAKYCDHIVIRGRTSAGSYSAKAKALAIDRAVRVKTFLINKGVDAAKIRITYLSHGGFDSDNSTSVGRAHNRRTQIDMIGVAPQYSVAQTSAVTQ